MSRFDTRTYRNFIATSLLAVSAAVGCGNDDTAAKESEGQHVALPSELSPLDTSTAPGQSGTTPGQSSGTPGQGGTPPPGQAGAPGSGGGACTGPNPLNCDDGNPCTTDTCVPATGCVHANNTLPCNDGNACTALDTCAGGICAGRTFDCSDNDACTADACDPATGGCKHTPIICTDDGNECTDDFCISSVGCIHPQAVRPCGDNNPCNGFDFCNAGVCQRGAPPDCDDHDACTVDFCDPTAQVTMECKHTPLVCTDDGNECTDDFCISDIGCIHPQAVRACGDNNPCNGFDFCHAGVCQRGATPDCDDHDPCTIDSCDPTAQVTMECKHTPLPCGDTNPCNGIDVCNAGVCVLGTPPDCDDHDACTADSCDPTSPRTWVCNHTSLPCADDGNECTDDFCVPALGCIHPQAVRPCGDTNPCNGIEFCNGGVCRPGTPPDCEDHDECTIDFCDPTANGTLGCKHAPGSDGILCSPTIDCSTLPDGSLCDPAGICSGGQCAECSRPQFEWPRFVPTSAGPPNPAATDTLMNPSGACSFVAQGSTLLAIRNVSELNCTLGDCTEGGVKWSTTLPSFATEPLGFPKVYRSSDSTHPEVILATAGPYLFKANADTGLLLSTVDTRRRFPDGSLQCPTVPGDRLSLATNVQTYDDGNADFRNDVTRNGRPPDDVIFVSTVDGCGDTTRNRVIAYYAHTLQLKWAFNFNATFRVGGFIEGCILDNATNRLFCAADLPSPAGGQSSLFALNTLDGSLVWGTNAGALVNRPMLVHGRLYTANRAGEVRAWDPSGNGTGSGAPLWSNPVAAASVGATFITTPILVPAATAAEADKILALDTNGLVQAVRDLGTSGDLFTTIQARDPLTTDVVFTTAPVYAPAFAKVYAGTNNGKLEQVDATRLPLGVESFLIVDRNSTIGPITADATGSVFNRLDVMMIPEPSGGGANAVGRVLIPLCLTNPPGG